MPAREQFWLAAALLVAIVAAAPAGTRAHGGPEKVVDDRFVVSVALAPAGDATRLRFFLRDFRTGREPADPLSFRVRILEEGAPVVLYRGSSSPMGAGRADVLYRFPRDGFYEVFFEFWLDREPGQVFRPEDWRIWIGRTRTAEAWVPIGVAGVLTLAAAVASVSLRRARRVAPAPEREGV